ncbi:MAG: hypothetical protein ACJ75M_07680, partial [Actinomycetes bacterium]
PKARGLYYSVGFRELSRDAPIIKRPRAEDWSFGWSEDGSVTVPKLATRQPADVNVAMTSCSG